VTGGRTILGVGSGDPVDEPEHRAFGFPILDTAERRTHLAETVEALRALFDGRPYPGGERIPAMSGPLLPPPVRPGGPPLWVAGTAGAAVRLAARLADGWNGWGLDLPAFGRAAALLGREAEAAGRRVEATWAGIVLVGETQAEAASLLEARRARGMADPAWTGSA
jgi:alkanesulfonate monooxygenase SsuD/methylene tetrahydromethanopterin reductase-like flavin-dependent oxidoreductase (luciferase family)